MRRRDDLQGFVPWILVASSIHTELNGHCYGVIVSPQTNHNWPGRRRYAHHDDHGHHSVGATLQKTGPGLNVRACLLTTAAGESEYGPPRRTCRGARFPVAASDPGCRRSNTAVPGSDRPTTRGTRGCHAGPAGSSWRRRPPPNIQKHRPPCPPRKRTFESPARLSDTAES